MLELVVSVESLGSAVMAVQVEVLFVIVSPVDEVVVVFFGVMGVVVVTVVVDVCVAPVAVVSGVFVLQAPKDATFT